MPPRQFPPDRRRHRADLQVPPLAHPHRRKVPTQPEVPAGRPYPKHGARRDGRPRRGDL